MSHIRLRNVRLRYVGENFSISPPIKDDTGLRARVIGDSVFHYRVVNRQVFFANQRQRCDNQRHLSRFPIVGFFLVCLLSRRVDGVY